VVNPKQTVCPYPFKDLAGVGVAYQLLLAVRQAMGSAVDLSDILEFVAMGTIADVVQLAGPNRIMVREGLRHLSRTQRARYYPE
jgi:single-stranded-DNA-specific exonuclease